jgi:hypothetical protein
MRRVRWFVSRGHCLAPRIGGAARQADQKLALTTEPPAQCRKLTAGQSDKPRHQRETDPESVFGPIDHQIENRLDAAYVLQRATF